MFQLFVRFDLFVSSWLSERCSQPRACFRVELQRITKGFAASAAR
jgi:hypothetical protein